MHLIKNQCYITMDLSVYKIVEKYYCMDSNPVNN